jgi:ribose 5-phosphate isomerase B
MKISIGSDHRGYAHKDAIIQNFPDITWIDVGTENGHDHVDYPIFTKKVCQSVLDQSTDRGILICGSGIGVSIAANRFAKIYAALCWSPEVARVAREHDCANVLALSSDFVSHDVTIQIVKTWLEAEFLGGKYQKRLDMLELG